MKKRFGKLKWISAGLLALFFLFAFILGGGCRLDKEGGRGKVQFSLSLNEGSRAYTQEEVLDMAAGFVVTIVDSADNPVYENEFLSIFSIGTTKFPVTAPIALDIGDYNLTRFDIVDETSTIIFSTPLEGSLMAGYVADPLPIAFSIAKDAVTQVVPEVLAVDDSEPEDFGYATFSFEVVNIFDFYIACFVYNEGINDFLLTEADLVVQGDSMEILNMPGLPAITNRIYVSEDYTEYTLVVNKTGYQEWSAVYTLAALNNDCAENCPVIVVLLPQTGPTATPTTPPTPTPTPTPPPTAFCGLYLSPVTQTVTAGDTFTVDLMANTGVQEMSAYELTISYASPELTLDSVVNSPLTSAQGFLLTPNDLSGTVVLNGFGTGSLPAGDGIHLCILTFTATVTGTYTFDFADIAAVVDTDFNDICPPFTGLPADVTVE